MAQRTVRRGSCVMRRLAAASTVALVFCACAVAAAGKRDRHSSKTGPALQELLRRNYSASSDFTRSCAEHGRLFQDAAAAFQFDSPGLDLIRCVAAEQAEQDFSDGDVYFVLLSGSVDSPARYKCKVCDSRWYPVDRDPLVQRPLEECALSDRIELELEKHPAEGGGTRLDGVRCHPAYRKGCDRGYGWCHGSCCRAEALFYYPQLQKPIGSGRLLTTKSAGPREAPLLRLLTPATKTKTAGAH